METRVGCGVRGLDFIKYTCAAAYVIQAVTEFSADLTSTLRSCYVLV
jgi:hypothetical protein